ncbi:unnamed protein product, partial [Musa textilis]
IAGFHFQDGTEALGCPQNNTTSPFHDTGSDDFITDKNLSVNSNSNRSDNPIFHTGNICPTISFSLSNLTGEISADDHEDCGVFPCSSQVSQHGILIRNPDICICRRGMKQR